MRNVHMMHMSPFRDAIFMMQMSHAGVRMQSLSMMVPAHIFNCDANVSLQGWRCKNLVVQMPPYRYVMIQLPPCGYVLMQTQIIQKFPLFSKQSSLSAWNQNIFKTWFITPEKSSSFVDLRLSKNWWPLLENLQIRHWLGIWWSGSKDLFSQLG